MGGSSSTTVTKTTPTPEEIEFDKQQIALAQQQLALIQEEHGWQSDIFNITKPLLEKYSTLVNQQYDEMMTPEAQSLRQKQTQIDSALADQTLRNIPIQDELLQQQLDQIKRGGAATPEQAALIDEIAQKGIQAGQSDIDQGYSDALRQIKEQFAPGHGFRPSDSPVLDAADLAAKETLRQKGLLETTMQGNAANAKLNFPLNAAALTSGINQFQQNYNASMNQFMAGLKDSATNNRNQFTSSLFEAPFNAAAGGIGLANAARPTPISFARNSTQTTTQSGGFGSILGGVGGLLSGVGSLFSSKKIKTNVKPMTDSIGGSQTGASSGMTMADYGAVPGTYSEGKQKQGVGVATPQSNQEVLDNITSIPMQSWQYDPATGLDDGQQHVGPFAEDFNTAIGQPPNPTINAVDAFGSLTAATQAMNDRVNKLEAAMTKPDGSSYTQPNKDQIKSINAGYLQRNPDGSLTNVGDPSQRDMRRPQQQAFDAMANPPRPGSQDWWTAYNQFGGSSAPMKGDYGAPSPVPGSNRVFPDLPTPTVSQIRNKFPDQFAKISDAQLKNAIAKNPRHWQEIFAYGPEQAKANRKSLQTTPFGPAYRGQVYWPKGDVPTIDANNSTDYALMALQNSGNNNFGNQVNPWQKKYAA